MAYPAATLAYTSIAKGVSPTTLTAVMASVPPPEAILEELGCFLTSDSTAAAGSVVTRTLVLSCAAHTAATATVASHPGASGGPIVSAAVTGAGVGFVRPPVCQVNEESTESLTTFLGSRGKGARLQAYLGLVSNANQIAAGTGYSVQTIVGLVGGLPGGTNRVTQARPGFGAVDPSLWTGTTGCGVRVSDPPASVALNTLGCVRSISVKTPGKGYNPATTSVVFTEAVHVPGGRAPFAVPFFDGKGRCTKVMVVEPGMGFVTTPVPVLVDTSGTAPLAAQLRCNMMRGRAAKLTPTLSMAGAITALSVSDSGDGYIEMPQAVIFDPTGAGSGAIYTVGPIPGNPGAGTPSCFGVSRIDVLAQGGGYVAPTVTVQDFFTATGLVAVSQGQQQTLLGAFHNLMKTALSNLVGTAVTETLS